MSSGCYLELSRHYSVVAPDYCYRYNVVGIMVPVVHHGVGYSGRLCGGARWWKDTRVYPGSGRKNA
jgi:hypothetical protein